MAHLMNIKRVKNECEARFLLSYTPFQKHYAKSENSCDCLYWDLALISIYSEIHNRI